MEWGYSAPTGLFNLMLPLVPRRVNITQTESYREFLFTKLSHSENKDPQDSQDEGDTAAVQALVE